MGSFQPKGSDGPSPTNVSRDPSSYWLRSEPELKQPAMEELSEPGLVKRARVVSCLDSILETIPENVTDFDGLGQ